MPIRTDHPLQRKNRRGIILVFLLVVSFCDLSKQTQGNPREYIFSAFFASKILNTLENGSIEAICYPSVQMNLSFENLAIKPHVFDEKYELVHVHDSCVVNKVNGGYLEQGLSDCDVFDYSSEIILWEKDKVDMPENLFVQLQEKYKIEL